MNKKTFRKLFHRYNTGVATAEEKAFIEAYYAAFDLRPDVMEQLSEAEQQKLEQVLFADLMKRTTAPPLRAVGGKPWLRVAAAFIIILLGTAIYFSGIFKKQATPATVTNTQKDVPAPATNRAVVTLADGRQVFLDSAGNGQLAQQGNMKLVKLANGQIAYQMTDGSSSPLSPGRGSRSLSGGGEAYNTLTNPRGSKVIDMTLSDGSRVWLNAGSSITYPVVFTGNERKVTMTGEAYFEIVPLSRGRGSSRSLLGGGEAKMPFIVQKGDMQVTVLGTHFNVNAYDDESDIKVTLLEGSVKVSLPSPSGESPDRYREGVRPEVTLKPGQQAAITKNQKPETRNNIDIEQVMAWKNGKFDFGQGTDIRSIMRQIGRWYDVEIEYRDDIRQQFGGGISREANVSDVLKNFELTGRVHFIIEGKKIIVKR